MHLSRIRGDEVALCGRLDWQVDKAQNHCVGVATDELSAFVSLRGGRFGVNESHGIGEAAQTVKKSPQAS